LKDERTTLRVPRDSATGALAAYFHMQVGMSLRTPSHEDVLGLTVRAKQWINASICPIEASTQLKKGVTNSSEASTQLKKGVTNSSEASTQLKKGVTNSSEASNESNEPYAQSRAAFTRWMTAFNHPFEAATRRAEAATRRSEASTQLKTVVTNSSEASDESYAPCAPSVTAFIQWVTAFTQWLTAFTQWVTAFTQWITGFIRPFEATARRAEPFFYFFSPVKQWTAGEIDLDVAVTETVLAFIRSLKALAGSSMLGTLRLIPDHAFAPGAALAPMYVRRTSMTSMGSARTTVFDADGPSPSIVCNKRSCIAPGLAAIVAAASARAPAAKRSPSALMIVARFSRSDDAWRDIIFLSSSGTSMSSSLMPSTCRPHDLLWTSTLRAISVSSRSWCDKSSSSVSRPTTSRSVACANRSIATR